MVTKTYPATAFRQGTGGDAPWLVSFVVPAEELLEWASIPQRANPDLLGFQRIEDPVRVDRAKRFFADFPGNQSPTSLVVGLHPLIGGEADTARLVVDEGETDTPIKHCRLIVDYNPEVSLEAVRARLKRQIAGRLNGGDAEAEAASDAEENELPEDAITVTSSDEGGTSGASPVDASVEVDDDSSTESVELGRSLLSEMLKRLDDDIWCKTHEAALRELAKPATVIDGQHRVRGAAKCERGIPFSVIGLVNCSWAEQVFQFTVVNYTAQGIPDQFITANAALSLTRSELKILESRLQQAGVKVVEYELMRIVNFDSRSPFHDLINLTQKKVEGKIGFRTMIQVAKTWWVASDPTLQQIVTNLYPDLLGDKRKDIRARIQRWQNQDHWGLFFIDFWTIVQEHFAGETARDGKPLWSVGSSNLLLAVVVQALQETFLTSIRNFPDTFFDASSSEDPITEMRNRMKKQVKVFISHYKPDLFRREWGMKSLNVGPGRIALRDVLRAILDSRGSYQYAKSALITGST